MSNRTVNWRWVGAFGYALQASVMAPNYGQFNHWLISSAWRGVQRLPAAGQQQQQAINEWSARRWGDLDDVPVEACQTAPDPNAVPITLEQYSALKQIDQPQYGDVQQILGESSLACTTTTGAHRYLADWRGEALDITYPSANGFVASIQWANPGPDTGAGSGLAADQ